MASKVHSVGLDNDTYQELVKVRQIMQRSICPTCGKGGGNIPMKDVARYVISKGLEVLKDGGFFDRVTKS